MNWTREQAVWVATAVEGVCPHYGCHVALTGGTLYKEGARKDLDLLFYRIRQVPQIDIEGLFVALDNIGFQVYVPDNQLDLWVYKACLLGKTVDLFFPENTGVPKGLKEMGQTYF